MVLKLVADLGILTLPNRFYNLDEVGLALDPKARKCFYHCGTKNAQILVPSERKTMLPILFCGCTSGEHMPPFVKYKDKDNQIRIICMMGGPEHCAYNVTSSSWMEDFVFKEWFEEIFLKQ